MKFTSLLLAAIPSLVSANVISLTDESYEALTKDKVVFIKFFAPWCGHCKAMAGDWEELGKAMAEEKPELLIAEVDCTSEETDNICDANNIEGFPTLKYGDPEYLESYEGSREFDEMYSFATTGLKVSCSPKNVDLCEEEEKAELEKLLALSYEELLAMVQEFDKKMKDFETSFDDSTESLEEEYMKMVQENQIAKEEAKAGSNYALLKSVQSLREFAGSPNDEL